MKRPLNPLLYRLLESHFRKVRISNEGVAQIARYRHDPLTDRESLQVIEPGEYYQVCCPFCNDTRFRLWINHMWGKMGDDGRRNLWLAICYNDNCLGDADRRYEFYDKLTSRDGPALGRARIIPGKEIDPSERKADWPGPVTRVDRLPKDHQAVQYLLSREFDPQKIGRFYNVHFCHESNLWLAKGRLIIPLYENKQFVGWQARYVGELPWHDKTKDLPPKYYTMPNTPRRMVVYNLRNARQYRTGVIMEGPTDVWSLGPMGVCTLGSTMTIQQIRGFRDCFGDSTAVLLYDPDVRDDPKKWPGIQRTIKKLKESIPKGLAVVWLPKGRDPGSLDRQFLREYVTGEAKKQGVAVSWEKR